MTGVDLESAVGPSRRSRETVALRWMIVLAGVIGGCVLGVAYVPVVFIPESISYHQANPQYYDPTVYFPIGLIIGPFHGLIYGLLAILGAFVLEVIIVRLTKSVAIEVVAVAAGATIGVAVAYLLAPPFSLKFGLIYVAACWALGVAVFVAITLYCRGRLRFRRT